MSLADSVSKVRARSWREIGIAAEALLFLGVFRGAILLLPFRRITQIMGLTQNSTEQSATSASGSGPGPAVIGWAIQAAAARTPWESACLAQALTGVAMLARRGIASTLFLGVARDGIGAEAMKAHAWLRCGDLILTGAGGMEQYTAISSFSRPPASAAGRQSTSGTNR